MITCEIEECAHHIEGDTCSVPGGPDIRLVDDPYHFLFICEDMTLMDLSDEEDG